MTSCNLCRIVPDALPAVGSLVLTSLPAKDAGRLAEALRPYGIELDPIEGGLWRFDLFDGAFEIVRDWARFVAEELMAEGHYVLLQSGEALSFAHMGKLRPLAYLAKRLKNAWVMEMIRENRFTVHYHPIVEAANPNRIYAHECLMRGLTPEGAIVPPMTILDAADEEGMIFHLDRVGRLNAIQGFADQGVGGKAFINFNPVSVYNPIACLASTVVAAKAAGLTPDRIVFELIERSQVADEAHLMRIVDFYRAAGYGVALDDVGAGYSGLNILSSLRPDYIKLDMHLIRGVDRDPVRQSIVGNLLDMARKLDIQTVVEGVETEGEYEFARREGADFVQGYLFGKPAAVARGAVSLGMAA